MTIHKGVYIPPDSAWQPPEAMPGSRRQFDERADRQTPQGTRPPRVEDMDD